MRSVILVGFIVWLVATGVNTVDWILTAACAAFLLLTLYQLWQQYRAEGAPWQHG